MIRHRDVTASGLRFHVAESGPTNGPLVLLLHGFPEFWWSWRHQLEALGAQGLHVVAPDLRGYGGTDKPPRGYDGFTLSADIAGLIRALGAKDAHVVGHDWGGALAWSTATLHPKAVNRLTVVSIPHPLRLRDALRSDLEQARMSSYMGFFQLPRLPENRLASGDLVSELLHRWGGPGFPDSETEQQCREAMAIPGAAHCALEYYRWAFRSQLRPSGHRYGALLARGVQAPVLQVHGEVDGCIKVDTARGSERWCHGGYRLEVLDGVGHFPHQEVPEVVTELIAQAA